jgi:hypothetical protein
MIWYSDIRRIFHVGIEHKVPEVATAPEIAHILRVVVIVVGGVGDEGEDAEGTPLKFVA